MNPNSTSTTQLALDCEAIIQLIPDYAFGLTDDDQTRLVESNLERCPEAGALLDEYRALQAEMRESVTQVEPSSELGERLKAAVAMDAVVAADAPGARETLGNQVLAGAFEAVGDDKSAVTSQVQPLPQARPQPFGQSFGQSFEQPVGQRQPRRRFYVAWIAVAAALIALVVTNVYWFDRVNDLSGRLDAMIAINNASSANNAFVLTDTSALHWVRLAGTQEDVSASAFMMWNADSKTGLLYARGFPELPPGELYHLWLTRDGERVFAGVFQVDPQGDGALLFRSPEPINSFTNAGITAEMQTSTNATPDVTSAATPNATPGATNTPPPPIVSGSL